MKKVIVAALLLLVGSFGCGKNFEWLPDSPDIPTPAQAGYSTVFVSSTITANPSSSTPQALAVASGTIFAVDSPNHRVLRYNAGTGAFIDTFGSEGTTDGQLSDPAGIAVNGSVVYVADHPTPTTGRIQTFSSDGAFRTSFGDIGGQLNKVFGLGIAGSVLYATEVDTGNVRKIDVSNESAPALALSGNIQRVFSTSHAVGVDSSGNVYVANTGGNNIFRYNNSGGNEFAFTHTGDGALNTPEGIAVFDNEVFVADSKKHRVAIFNASTGVFVTSFGTQGNSRGQFTTPLGIAADSSGVYVVDSTGRIQKFVKKQ